MVAVVLPLGAPEATSPMKAARSTGLGPGTFLISILLTGLSTNLESRTPDTLTVRGAALQSLSEGEWVRFTSEPDGLRGGQGPGARRNGARADIEPRPLRVPATSIDTLWTRAKATGTGALIGAVMKDMRGQADAAKVRELVNTKLGI